MPSLYVTNRHAPKSVKQPLVRKALVFATAPNVQPSAKRTRSEEARSANVHGYAIMIVTGNDRKGTPGR
ncbi:hypothetical protein GGP41_003148 [Bipolaris sorokiniana]|uniref:Uncharacterized protein n=1 Tax=Cochliobolus sativus TaxID=45130 RepID=A0A8H5Z8G7_COCSA|nr:hypothetical protein GGP41_003148 [Bipolaris sorokiniana]